MDIFNQSYQKSLPQLKDMLGIPNIKDVSGYSRLRWFGHLEHMSNDNWPTKVVYFQIPGAIIGGGHRKRKRIYNMKKVLESLKTCVEQGRIVKSNQTVSKTECCPNPNKGEPRTLKQIVNR